MDHAIWIEKYRPQTFDDIRGQKQIISRIAALVEQRNLPHLMFSGPAGVGKTTTALVVAKTLFGEDWRSNFLELNASDERGIDVVRSKVKNFARMKAIGDVPFKIIYLDESDALTKEAQQALRRTMENYTGNCRFILACNYSSKIIDPIQSRCAVFRFKPLEEDEALILIEKIAKAEGLTLDDGARKALFTVSYGDCRKLENTLQSCASLGKVVSEEMVYDVASFARPEELDDVLSLALSAKFEAARDRLLTVMLKYGLSGLDVIRQLQAGMWKLEIDPRKKVDLIDACGEIEFRMVEGSDEHIQLEALLARVMASGFKD